MELNPTDLCLIHMTSLHYSTPVMSSCPLLLIIVWAWYLYRPLLYIIHRVALFFFMPVQMHQSFVSNVLAVYSLHLHQTNLCFYHGGILR